ncbi:hypothetical protein APY03_0215 [Variovorax sp. WDL1]|nr:hypothetical protein APY03_0215 [Variovorax sp. WDL1]
MFEQAIVAPAAPVAAAVQPAAGVRGGVGNEGLLRQLGAVEVADGKTGAADADFTRDADRASLALRIDDPDAGVRNGPADGHAAASELRIVHAPGGRVNGGLGGPVHVPELAATCAERQGQVAGQGLAAGDGLQPGAALPLRIEQQPPGGRRALQQGDLLAFDELAEGLPVLGRLARDQHDFGADLQGEDQLHDGNVEAQRGGGRDAVLGPHAQGVAHALEQVGHRGMRDAHALGLAGRAGGIDEDGHVAGLRVARARVQRRGRGVQPLDVLVEPEHLRVAVLAPGARRVGDAGGGDQQAELRILCLVVEARLREIRVERHVGCPALEHGEQGDQHVRVSFEAQPDSVAAAHAASAQGMRQPVGARIQFEVGPLPAFVPQRCAIRLRRRRLLEPCMDEAAARQRSGCRLKDKEARFFGGIDEVDTAERHAGLAHGGLQQAFVHAHPAGDGLVVEKVDVVLHFPLHAAGDRREVEEELEVLVRTRNASQLRVQAGELVGGALAARVDIEEHADQRQTARVARHYQLLEERAVGEVLMLEGIEQQAAALAGQLGQRRRGVHRDPQRQEVGAMADEPGHVAGELPRGGDADDQVVLPGEAMQQAGEGAEERAIQTGARSGGQLANTVDELGVEQTIPPARCEGPHRGARPVERQFEHRRTAAAEATQPVIDVALHARAGRFVGFPLRVVRIVRRRLGRWSQAPLVRIKLAELGADHAQGPAVAHGVVGADQEGVVFRPCAVERRAKERALLQDEAFADCGVEGLGQQALTLRCIGLRQVDALQHGAGRWRNEELRAIGREGRAKTVVAFDQAIHRALQRSFVQRAGQMQRAGLVVRQRSFLAQAIAEPDFALRLGARDDRLELAERERIEIVGVRLVGLVSCTSHKSIL